MGTERAFHFHSAQFSCIVLLSVKAKPGRPIGAVVCTLASITHLLITDEASPLIFYPILRQTLTLYPMLSLNLMYCCCDIGTRSNMRKKGLFWLRVLGLESLVMRTAWQCWEEQKLADPISIGAQEAGCKEHRHELPTIPGFISVFDDFKLLMCSYSYSLVKYIHFNIRRDVSFIAF